MQSIRNRAKNRFPTVLLTLLSIVQALALEFLWDHFRHRAELYEASLEAVMGWLQISATLNVIILIQFLLIDLMGSDNVGRWLIVLAALFALMNVVNHLAMRRARQDAANSEFFDQFQPATLKDFAPMIATVTVLTIGGGLLWNSDNSGWPAVAALLVILIGLALEVHKAARFWRMSMGVK